MSYSSLRVIWLPTATTKSSGTMSDKTVPMIFYHVQILE